MVDVAATVSRSCDPWRAAARAAASDVGTTGPPLRMPSCRRLVVVVAHPHEELCAAGGLMRDLVNRGLPVSVLVVTDTGAEYLGTAYRTLGLTGVRRYRLGLPGGCVEAAEHDVMAAVSELVGFADPEGLWCLTPWERDGHPDHDAVGRAAATACSAYRLPLLRYPIASAERLRSSDMTQGQVRHLTLTEPVRRRKHRALIRLRAQSLTADAEQVATTEEFLVSCRMARG
ncbi:PIG-L family deacetylase [Pseudonocardia sp. NPDC049154]|uniref:PIG-L deacetylase family protein n=1 Tax=Pseudonocardia sp. NPDC049154 TaxID=3155501 RepID=UPI0033D729BD